MDIIDVVIVGAGIVGCSAAFELSKLGLKVEVIEKHKPGAMGSGWTLAGVRQSGRHESELPLAKYYRLYYLNHESQNHLLKLF